MARSLRRFVLQGGLLTALFLILSGPGSAEAITAEDLTLEEQAGQVLCVTLQGKAVTGRNLLDLADLRPGGVILYRSTENVGTPAEITRFTRDMQKWALICSGIPLMIAVDQEGGRVARLREGVTLFPGNMALGAAGDPALAERAARVTGRELRTLGITVDFAPVMDVNVNPKNPVIGDRSFGSSPEEVTDFGIAAARGYMEGGVLPVIKHFPGHGDTSVDSHLGLPLVPHDRERLERVELFPFRAALAAGVPAVMTAHIRVPALEPEPLPATFSKAIIGDLLRRDMGFDGLIFSDSMGMGAIREGWSAADAAVKTIQAGVDVLIYGADSGRKHETPRVVRDALVAAVRRGDISRERLRESVNRILAAKEKLGLFEDPFPREGSLAGLASPESTGLARNIARRSLTVIRNRGEILPVGEEGPFIILWPERLRKYLPSFRECCPMFEPFVIPGELSAEREAAIKKDLSGREVIFAGCFDLFRDPSLGRLLRGLPADRLVLLSFRSPYDVMEVPAAGAALALYGNRPVTLKALDDFLRGRFVPSGTLPVELAEGY